ncbi:tetratricopeptide repeat protein [Niveispirillum fermenti]|uniref:surface lipoprotein assembly modifier n=1 Tax=Niveispirillum fermenti TaxID=1233113 RepID=UPI003A87815F
MTRQKMPPVIRGAILAGLTMAAAMPAAAEVDGVVQQATGHLQAAKAGDAYAMLAPLAAERAGDPDFDYALGLAAADSGHPAEAIIAFQRVLAIQPDNAQARAELARAYALAGDIDTARAQFDTVVQDPSLPDPVRQRFDRLVRDFDRQIAGGGTDLSGFFDLSGGWDSNINTATDLTQITIPLFAGLGPGALGAAARKTGKSYYEMQGAVSIVSAVSRQTRLFGSALGSWRDNVDSKAFDQASAALTGGVAHTLPSRDVLSLSGQFQNFWLGHDSYRQSYGAIGQYTHLLAGGRALTVAGQLFRLDYENDPLRDADRYGAAISYIDRVMVATLSGGKEETRRRSGDHLSNSYLGASLGFEQPVGGVNLVGGLSAERRRYDARDALFLKKRADEQVDASFGVKVPVADRVYLRPRVTYTRNWSNIDLYDYERVTVNLGLRAEF